LIAPGRDPAGPIFGYCIADIGCDPVVAMIRQRLMIQSVALVGLMAAGPLMADDEDRGWIEESDANAQYVAESSARVFPEFQAWAALEEADEEIVLLDGSLTQRAVATFKDQVVELNRLKQQADDPRVVQDLDIMIASRDRLVRDLQAQDELLLPYVNVSQTVFAGLSALLDPQTAEARRPAALVRLKRYAGLETGYRPIAELARQRLEERMDSGDLLPPFRGQVEKDLENSPRYMAGIEQLFSASGLSGYEQDLGVLRQQIAAYDEWLRETLLPRARDDFRQPGSLYELALEKWGINATPDQLIEDGLAGFIQIRSEMEALAPLVAESRGWELTDYRDVIRELRKEQLAGDGIVTRYREVNAELEDIIVQQNIVSLPERPAIIRIATDAEAAAQPQPTLNIPPLVNNQGELVEFLIPPTEPADGEGLPASADETFKAGTWTLAAHELRPGHELQFSTMLDNGVSLARAHYAFNSVNVEGWALYAEAEVKPYLPLDGQLIGLQWRLQRAARCFLDPMLNTGRITPEEARRIMLDDVVVTPRTAELELNRYMFAMPGQAPAYYYGYRRLLEIRAMAEIALGESFDRRSFHDFVLDQGLLPPDLLEKAVVQEYVPSIPVGGDRQSL